MFFCRMMLVVLGLLWFVPAGLGVEDVRRDFTLEELRNKGYLPEGQILPPDKDTPFERVKLVNDGNQLKVFPLITVEKPNLVRLYYALDGRTKYEGVEGTGYFEMWQVLRDGRKFTQKGLGGQETRWWRSLQGSCDWRKFGLFFARPEDEAKRPEKIGLNLVLPGRGTVYVAKLYFVQFRDLPAKSKPASSWWVRFWIILSSLTGLVSMGGIYRFKSRRRILALGLLAVSLASLLWYGVFAG